MELRHIGFVSLTANAGLGMVLRPTRALYRNYLGKSRFDNLYLPPFEFAKEGSNEN